MALLAFQKPNKILLQKADDFDGSFEFKPLEPGFGVTIGNALRRVLLSSLEGYAITAVKISGVEHEFSTIKGVLEDVTEIILNLKQVRIKKIIDDDSVEREKINIVLNKREEFVAGDIEKFSTSFQVTNPELVICNMDRNVELDIELTIQKGRGYVPAEENENPDADLGTIAIDAIFTPIKNVRYHVENTRVEQKTDFEKLVIEINTDGTIHPEDAIKEASRIMIQHLMLITDENITFDEHDGSEPNVVDEKILHMRKMLKTPLEDLELSVRAYNCLKAAKINTLQQLVQYDEATLLKFRNFGKKSLTEIKALLNEKDLDFGMDVSKYDLDEE